MVEALCIFEDINYANLHPLVYFRPVYDLRCGILTLREKIQLCYPDLPVILHSRKYLADKIKSENKGYRVNELDADVNSCLFINGSVLGNPDLVNTIDAKDDSKIYMNGEKLIAVKLSGKNLKKYGNVFKELFSATIFNDIEIEQVQTDFVNYPWDLVNRNAEQISIDYNRILRQDKSLHNGTIYQGAHLMNPDNIYIGNGTKIKPGVVLDAEEGPIFIGNNVTVMPNAVIEGPCYIGNKSKIKIGAKIYEGTSIGEVCKVGGEVDESIIHSYSNKQHDGFLGHAYLGSWVNLGADTNNSDLKNNYGNVKVTINEKTIDSGSMFVGLTMGDHSKTGINTMFNTGTVVGVSSNIFGSGFPDKYIPSFSWGGVESMMNYKLNKSIEVAKRVMARRNIQFTDTDESLFKHVYQLTEPERRNTKM